MGPAVSLGDLDGRGGTGEAGHASLEGRNLRPRSPTASVDARYTEFVRGSRLKSHTKKIQISLKFQGFSSCTAVAYQSKLVVVSSVNEFYLSQCAVAHTYLEINFPQ